MTDEKSSATAEEWRVIGAVTLEEGQWMNLWQPPAWDGQPAGVVDRLAARRTELMQQGQDVLDTARADGRDDVKATEAAIVDDVLAQLRVLGEAPCWNSPDALRSVDGARVATRCPAVIVQERAGELRAVYAAELHNGGWIPAGQGLGTDTYCGTVNATDAAGWIAGQ
ncbi:hypothetical protein Y900_025515 [Mycolicibacterium aromaticivorans JS19b1 = JCM 16368]|uniref:Uncharacterized protein n=1 Tax=Mycolicibacterium aromaticivorans JS19b1 = JCM 16368 TaxID=1440774 RepID=A0A064CU04_9MYCO|nr:hypothetical protein [Mycolicibacterium aromaticivorans]KDF02199.1 hypothetical protein Y900_025515 [Mycolicibacterium aromaticivorans JS19b1 = JCM 16368]